MSDAVAPPPAAEVPSVPTSRVICAGLAVVCAVMVLVLLQLKPRVAVSDESGGPSSEHAICSSVWTTGGYLFTGGDADWENGLTADSDGYSASPQEESSTEAKCDRLRTRYTAESTLLIVPMLWLAWLAFRRRSYDGELAELSREVAKLRPLEDEVKELRRRLGE